MFVLNRSLLSYDITLHYVEVDTIYNIIIGVLSYIHITPFIAKAGVRVGDFKTYC